MISTLVMTRLGYVQDGQMIAMKPSNAKLRADMTGLRRRRRCQLILSVRVKCHRHRQCAAEAVALRLRDPGAKRVVEKLGIAFTDTATQV